MPMVMRCSFSNRLRHFSISSVLILTLSLFGSVQCRGQFSADDYQVGLMLSAEPTPESPRLVSSVLTVALGVFGVHRMYLGTDLRVPIFYTLTLGGGLGVLPLIDLGCILFTKDLEGYYNHPGVFMWVPQKKPAPREPASP